MGNVNELWEKFLNGDLSSWEKIFNKFYKDLYGYGLKLSGQKEMTKDCIHELFVNIWNRRAHLSEVESVKAYLLVSLRRSMLKKMKKKRKYYKDVENPADHSTKIKFSPELLIINDEIEAEKIEALYEAIEELPNRQKEILYLKYFNGLTYREIEQVLSIKYQSIKNHVYRAITKLREIMGDEISNIAIALVPFLILLLL